MITLSAGVFRLTYALRTTAEPGTDIQFGMDFKVEQTSPLPLAQLIHPATAVGTNQANVWNIDNHAAASADASCLLFSNARGGTITDIPTELSKRNKGVRRTKFAVFRVDLGSNTVQSAGITFSYSIDTDSPEPRTIFDGLMATTITNEHKKLIVNRCSRARFS